MELRRTAQQATTFVPKRQQRKPRPGRANQPTKKSYYLQGDCTPLRRDNLIVNRTSTKTYVQDFMIDDLWTVTSSTSVVQLGGKSFKLNDIPQYASWTVIFDKYRIREIELHFVASGIQENTATSQVAPVFATALDFDNDTAPASVNEVLRRSKSTECVGTSSLKRHFIPRLAAEIYNGVASTNYSEAEPWTWLDCASAATPHYGLVYAMGTASTTSYIYRIHARYRVEFGFPIG